MTETTQSPDDAAAQRAAEQARLRKERREAKLKAGGSARLNKITGLGGRVPGGNNTHALMSLTLLDANIIYRTRTCHRNYHSD
jgi:hypothetical protein